MADNRLLLPTPLKPPRGQAEASGRNPYLEMMAETPQLTMPTSKGEERSLSERMRLANEAEKRYTAGGALEAVIFDPSKDKEVDLDNPGEVADHLRGMRIRETEERWNAMRPARTPAEFAVTIAGGLAGAAMSPESFIGLPTKFVTGAASGLQRILRAGVSGAAINTAIDPVVQGLRMKAGLQDTYSPTQTAISAAIGFALPAVVQTGIEGVRPRAVPTSPAREPARAGEPKPPPEPVPDDADIVLPEVVVSDQITALQRERDAIEDVPSIETPEGKIAFSLGQAIGGSFGNRATAEKAIEWATEAGRQDIVDAIRGRLDRAETVAEPAVRTSADPEEVAAEAVDVPPPPDIAPDLEPAMPPTVARPPEPEAAVPDSDFASVPNSAFNGDLEDSLNRIFLSDEFTGETIQLPQAGFRQDEIDALAAVGLADQGGTMSRAQYAAWSAERGRRLAPKRPDPSREVVDAARDVTPTPITDFTPEVSAAVAPTPNVRAGTFMFDAKDINVDAQTFQFKSEGDVEGVTPILRGVTKWDPNAAGQVMLWQRRDGTIFVADGHQRIGLAKRLIASGDETSIPIVGSLFREADGFTADAVMVHAAIKNIKEGSGGIIDAAKVLRKEPGLIKEIEEIGRAQTRQAVALTRVSDEVWRMVLNDVVEARDAAIIGRILPDDPMMQEAAAKALIRMKPANESEAEILVRRVRESELVKTEDAAQGSLLGDFESPDSTVAEEVRIVSRVIKTLAKDKNIMKRVAANSEAIERVGSKIAKQETLSAADESAALARIVESVAFSRGEVRDALLELAKELKNGAKGIGEAVDAFIVALRRAETIASKRSGSDGAGGRPEAVGGEDAEGSGLFGSAPERQAAAEPEPEVAAPPIKVAAGDLLRSESGRELAPVPELDFSTEAKTRNSLKRIDAWLVKEAVKEAKASGNDFVLTQMRGLDPKALSPADRDTVNSVLFGNAEGATARSVVKPLDHIVSSKELRDKFTDQSGETDGQALGNWWRDEIAGALQRGERVFIKAEGKEREIVRVDPLGPKDTNGNPWGSLAFATSPGDELIFRKQAASRELAMKPAEEPGAEGKPQLVLPGAERVPEATLAQRRADAPMRPRVAQKREAGPLFDDGSTQLDLIDMVRAAEGKGRELPFSQSLRGRPLRGDVGRADTGVPMAAGTPQAERLRDISDRVADTLGVPVRQGRIQSPGALGVYKDPAGVIRLKELDAFEVLTHEGGHALHLATANKSAIDGLIDTHSVEVERLAYIGTPPGSEREEGFAEWFRLWLTNREYARREAPAFTAEMEEWLRVNRPQVDEELRNAQSAYRDWLQAPSRQVLTGDLVSSGAPPIRTRVGRAIETDRAPSGESLMSLMGRFYTWTIDRLHPVNRGVRALLQIHKRNTGQSFDLKAASDPYKLLRLAASAHQAGHIDLINGVVPYRRLDPEGPSLAEPLELAVGKNWYGSWRSDEMIDFGGYLVARRSIVEFERFLAGEVPNPPGKLTLGDYRQAVADFEAAFPNYRAAAEMVYEWNRNLLQKKYDAGLVSLSYYEKALEKPDYVPFRRDFSEKIEELIQPAGPGGTNRQNIMKAYRGSLRSIINPIESMMSEAYSVAAIIARNDAIAALADLAVKAGPGGGAIAEHIPTTQLKPFEVDVLDALRKAGKDAGLDKAEIDDLILAASERLDSEDVIATIFRAGDAPEKGEPIVYYWRGGKRYGLRLADKRFGKDLYEAVTQIGTEQSNWYTTWLAIPARALRMGITTSPEFLLANYFRDQVAAFVLNTKFIPFVSGARGMADEIGQTRAARLYAQAGGIMGGANVASLDQARIGRSINALRKKGYNIRRLKDPREFLKLTEISETGTRVALFRQYFDTGRKQGLSEYEAVVEAAYQARDFMDFGRHGSKMLFLRRIVTFLNASLQGTDKELRVLVTDMAPMAKVFRRETLTAAERQMVSRSAQAWAKLGAISALTMTYAALYKDDPEHQQASEYLRATHWLFKLPGGDWAVVPKPYGFLATIINLSERLAEGLATDDPTWAGKWLRSIGYTMAVPFEPAGLAVPAEIGFNYDTFRDKPIVQQWDLGLEPWQQFYDYTSEFSKTVGKAINVSPAKIDHLIVGWTGSWGRNLLAVSNQIFDPQRRSDALYDWPVTGRFVKNLARGSDATDKFYGLVSETSGRLERKNNSYKEMVARGQEDEAGKFFGSLKDDEKVWVSLNQMESADEKRLHPLRRASDILRVYSGMRKDIANRNVVSVLTKRKVDVNATIASEINDQLGRAATAETRNAMIVIGEPGWAGREIMDASPYIEAIRTLAPEVSEEIEDRLGKAKVLPFEGVRLVWPELRQRLLQDGKDAFVLDLRGDAMSTLDRGAPWRPPEIQREPDTFLPTGVKRGKKLGNLIRGEDGRIKGLIGEDGRMLAEVKRRDAGGRITRVKRGIRERDVRRDDEGRALELA